MNEQQSRPIGISILSFFFLFRVLASGLTALILLVPGTPVDVLWRLNPHARAELLPLGMVAVGLMATVCFGCAAAALGLWRRRRWGYWTAIVISVVNLLGDAINSLMSRDWRTLNRHADRRSHDPVSIREEAIFRNRVTPNLTAVHEGPSRRARWELLMNCSVKS
jgi:hypothetical protein